MTDAVAPTTVKTDEVIKDYYGKTLQKTADLKTGVCTSPTDKYPKFIREAMQLVHEEVSSKYYGCGPVFPPALKGVRILDLGSGSGLDCYILSKVVGPDGFITGIDMTEEQLAVANKYIDHHTKVFGYPVPNVKFVKGDMEKMQEAGIESNQFDIIVSNCVINLAKDKRAVLSEAFRVLKEGGELYFSDVYADRDLPASLREHEDLWCECVVGALWWKDLYKLAKEIGFSSPRLVTARNISVEGKPYKEFLGDAKFVSATFSLFKLPAELSEPKTVQYEGNIEGYGEEFKFDHGITFKKGEECWVGAQLATTLQASRYKDYFTFSDGERGARKCSKQEIDPFEYCTENKGGSGCCC